jgi:hypothetical protein
MSEASGGVEVRQRPGTRSTAVRRIPTGARTSQGWPVFSCPAPADGITTANDIGFEGEPLLAKEAYSI